MPAKLDVALAAFLMYSPAFPDLSTWEIRRPRLKGAELGVVVADFDLGVGMASCAGWSVDASRRLGLFWGMVGLVDLVWDDIEAERMRVKKLRR